MVARPTMTVRRTLREKANRQPHIRQPPRPFVPHLFRGLSIEVMQPYLHWLPSFSRRVSQNMVDHQPMEFPPWMEPVHPQGGLLSGPRIRPNGLNRLKHECARMGGDMAFAHPVLGVRIPQVTW